MGSGRLGREPLGYTLPHKLLPVALRATNSTGVRVGLSDSVNNASKQDKPKRWRPRWSIRILLLVITLICAYFACWGPTKRRGVAVPDELRGQINSHLPQGSRSVKIDGVGNSGCLSCPAETSIDDTLSQVFPLADHSSCQP